MVPARTFHALPDPWQGAINKKTFHPAWGRKGRLFRGTTSIRRALPLRRAHYPDGPPKAFTCVCRVYQGLAITG